MLLKRCKVIKMKSKNLNLTMLMDLYEMTMANGYLMNNKQNQDAVFDVFFRKIPNGGGYAIMAGLDKIIPFIQNFKFDERALDYFRRKGYGRFCGKILRCKSKGESRNAEQHKQSAHFEDIRCIVILNAYIYYLRHNNRH